MTAEQVDIVDFKTDPPPESPIAQAYRQYVAQVRAYGQLLATSGIIGDRQMRTGLLFTGDGSIHWVS